MSDDFYAEDYNEKLISLVEQLTLKCPADDPLHHCPFSELRELTLKEKLEKIGALSTSELQELIQKHYDCFDEREWSPSKDHSP